MQAAENVWQELWRLEQQYETQKLQFHDLTVFNGVRPRQTCLGLGMHAIRHLND